MNTPSPRQPQPQTPYHLYILCLVFIGLTLIIFAVLKERSDSWNWLTDGGSVLMGMTFVALWLCWWRQAVLRKRNEEEQMRMRGELPARDMEFDCKTVCNGSGGSQ